jgi:hypothetical protein
MLVTICQLSFIHFSIHVMVFCMATGTDQLHFLACLACSEVRAEDSDYIICNFHTNEILSPKIYVSRKGRGRCSVAGTQPLTRCPPRHQQCDGCPRRCFGYSRSLLDTVSAHISLLPITYCIFFVPIFEYPVVMYLLIIIVVQ